MPLQLGSILDKLNMFFLHVLESLSPLGAGHVDTCMLCSLAKGTRSRNFIVHIKNIKLLFDLITCFLHN